ncbi:hypothetical protein CCMA1212_006020 [Trichoderma ghanense]|uniref:Uncharacterized protein n=1 Tax=Trichoderma ghanense TaxID=65468 RepID=A0ABY2H5H8_9HYPO
MARIEESAGGASRRGSEAIQTNGVAQMGDSAPEGERARGGKSERRGRQRAGSATSTIFLSRFRAIGGGEGEGEIEALGRWRPPAACLQNASFLSRVVPSLGLAARCFAEQDKGQVQGAGGLQSGRLKGELAARWLDRIET